MKAPIYITICILSSLAAIAEPTPVAPKDFANFELISGFHAHLDKVSGFEFRILEVDGSATVASNPIRLFLVATNNTLGDDLQSRVVVLPSVSAIKNIQYFDRPDRIRIEAVFDRSKNDGSKHWNVIGTIEITIPIRQGKLPPVIDAITQIKEAEQAAP